MRNNSRIEKYINALKKKDLFVKLVNPENDISITGIQIDSRKIKRDNMFICITGFSFDGHNYAKNAMENGASVIVCEKQLQNINLPQIIVKNSRKAEAIISQIFYQTENPGFKLIGITGTNGKTTISYLIENMLSNMGYKCGVIGTLGYQINGEKYKIERTTPDSLELHKILDAMKDMDFVIMEVSSHSLVLDRVYNMCFDAAVFTNLTQDHLDFHKDMESYAKAKYQLFEQLKNSGVAIIYKDDKYGKIFYDEIKRDKKSVSFESGDYKISNVSVSAKVSEFDVENDSENVHFVSNLIGGYNVINSVLSIATVKELTGSKLSDVAFVFKKDITVNGRLEKIANDRGIHIFVDYAHTPDAIKNVLSSLNEIKTKRIITVFGAGGNRDRKKRPLMYEEAIKKSDLVIVTSDNPRNENPIKIIEEILSNKYDKEKTLIYTDRKTAIQVAIKLAKKDDIVLIAGKGHETYQEIKGKKYYFNDKKEVETALKFSTKGNLFLPLGLFWIYKTLDKNIPVDFEDFIFYSIHTDSRKISKNSLFVALKGERFDGHDFVKDVIKNESVFALVNYDFDEDNPKLIKTKDTQKAYGILSAYYKAILNPFTIAITGSVGKTTTKEFLYMILSNANSVHKSKANENNQIGVPKTIFEYANQDFLISELGTNHFGEIEYLTDIVKPDAAIITNIGDSHLEFFKSKEGVFQEKIKIFKDNPPLKIVNGDDMYLKKTDAIKVGYHKKNDFVISKVISDTDKSIFYLNDEKYEIKTPYSVFVMNASLAISLAKKIGIDYLTIKDALSQKVDISMRMEIVEKNGVIFLNDCYNANPDSMKAAINFWKDYLNGKKHYAILGDMLELGEKSKELHIEIGNLLKEKENVISVGKFAKFYGANKHFDNVDEFLKSNYVHKLPIHSVVLIKASHGIGLDKIIRSL